MTDDPTASPPTQFDEPLHPLDELASAHLDGLADPAALAAAQHDPQFSGRIDRMGRARAVVRSGFGPTDLTRRDAALAAAMAAFDDPTAADPMPRNQSTAVVTPIEVAAARRSIPRRWRTIGIAAAVVAGALAAVPILTMNDGKPDSDLATELSAKDADTADENRTMAADAPFADTAAAPQASTAAGLGDYATYDDLAERVKTQLAPSGALGSATPTTLATTTTAPPLPATTTGGSAGGGEAASLPADDGCPPPSDQQVVYEGDATVEGHPVTVEVVQAPDGDRTLEVRDPVGNCDVVDSRKL
jgi:hypothetical protein